MTIAYVLKEALTKAEETAERIAQAKCSVVRFQDFDLEEIPSVRQIAKRLGPQVKLFVETTGENLNVSKISFLYDYKVCPVISVEGDNLDKIIWHQLHRLRRIEFEVLIDSEHLSDVGFCCRLVQEQIKKHALPNSPVLPVLVSDNLRADLFEVQLARMINRELASLYLEEPKKRVLFWQEHKFLQRVCRQFLSDRPEQIVVLNAQGIDRAIDDESPTQKAMRCYLAKAIKELGLTQVIEGLARPS